MRSRLPAGLSRDDEPFYLNLEFLDGTRGAHVNISGVSGVATKTTYATLPALQPVPLGRARRRGRQHQGAHLQREGRGPALPRPRQHRASPADQPARYARLGLPAGPFGSVCVLRPAGPRRPQRQRPTSPPASATSPRSSGPSSSSARDELLPFLFADAEDDRQQYTMVVHNVTARLQRRRAGGRRRGRGRRPGRAHLRRPGRAHRATRSTPTAPTCGRGRAIGAGTDQRLPAPAARRPAPPAPPHPGRRAPARAPPGRLRPGPGHGRRPPQPQRPGQAVRGRRRAAAGRSSARSGPGRPGRCSSSCSTSSTSTPRARGRARSRRSCSTWPSAAARWASSSIGAQQTASEVERRIVANSAIRVVGRLDSAEAARGEYGFLPPVQRQRATIIKPGTMLVCQPELPIPLVVQFPFPAWATRASEAARPALDRRRDARPRTGPASAMASPRPTTRSPGSPGCGSGRCSSCTPPTGTSARPCGGGRGPPSTRRCWPRSPRAPSASRSTLVIVAGDLFDTAAPTAEAERIVYRALLDLADGRPPGGRRRRQPRLRRSGSRRWRRCPRRAASTWPPPIRPPARRRRARARRRRRAGAAWRCCRSCRSATSSPPTCLMAPATPPTPTPAYADRVARILAALTARVPGRHGQPGRRPPDGHGRRAWAAASAAPTRSSTTGCRPPPSRRPPTTWRSGTCTAPSSLAGPGAAALLRLAAAARLRRDRQRAGRSTSSRPGPGTAGRGRGRCR